MAKDKRKRYTTYLFPSHLAALERIAKVSGKSVAHVITDALDTYLPEVGALKEAEAIPPSKNDIKKKLESEQKEASGG